MAIWICTRQRFCEKMGNEELDMDYALKIQKMGLDALQNKRLLPELFWEYYDIDPKDHIQGLQKGEKTQMRQAYIEITFILMMALCMFIAAIQLENDLDSGRTLAGPKNPK